MSSSSPSSSSSSSSSSSLSSAPRASHRWLSLRDRQVEYHKLVRLVSRAFHPPEEIIVLDALLHLQEKMDGIGASSSSSALHRVTEKDIQKLLKLPEKRILAILTRLRMQRVIQMTQTKASLEMQQQRASQEKEGAPVTSASNFIPYRQRKGGKDASFYQNLNTRSKIASYVCFVDYDAFVKVIKWRRYSVFEILNKKVDKSQVTYACPTPMCPMYKKPIELIDLLMRPPSDSFSSSSSSSSSKQVFGCEHCEVRDPHTGTAFPTPLVACEDASAAISGVSDSSQEQLKVTFNQQMAPISAQLRLVEALLEEELSTNPLEEMSSDDMARNERLNALEERELKLREEGQASSITVSFASDSTASSQLDTSSSLSTSADASSSSSNAPSASAAAAVSAAGGVRSLHVPTVAANQAKGMLIALPWENNSVKSMESQAKQRNEASKAEAEAQALRAKEEEERRYQADFNRELERMTAHAQKEALEATAAEESKQAETERSASEQGENAMEEAEEEDLGEVLISVQGKQVPLKEITQQDLSLMTEEEMALYEIYVDEGAY